MGSGVITYSVESNDTYEAENGHLHVRRKGLYRETERQKTP